ncbi:hypothetical protein GCM10009608_78570 [Pseudonocardia alaniniphila]
MIHSDSTGNSGSGRMDLISGLRRLVPNIGLGDNFSLTLIGGSVQGTKRYLGRSEHLPKAHIIEGGEADGAYITWSGLAAPTKRRLAESMGVPSLQVTYDE